MRRAQFVATLAAITLVLASGIALAYVRSSGSGTGSALAGTLQPPTLTALVTADTPRSTLVPGGSADLLLKVNNPNSYNVTLVGIAPKAGGSVTPIPAGSGCTGSTSGVTLTALAPMAITLGPGPNTIHISNGAAMSTASVTGCQGVAFAIDVTITVQK